MGDQGERHMVGVLRRSRLGAGFLERPRKEFPAPRHVEVGEGQRVAAPALLLETLELRRPPRPRVRARIPDLGDQVGVTQFGDGLQRLGPALEGTYGAFTAIAPQFVGENGFADGPQSVGGEGGRHRAVQVGARISVGPGRRFPGCSGSAAGQGNRGHRRGRLLEEFPARFRHGPRPPAIGLPES